MRCLYLDLDGTLLGRRASLLHDGEGNVSIDGVRAVQACLRADVEVVLMSGRRRAQVFEDARLLGQSSFIFEAGACVVLDGEEHWLTGELMPGELSIAEQIEHSGAPALLLEHYRGAPRVPRALARRTRSLTPLSRPRRGGRGRPLLAERGHGTCASSTTASSTAARRRSPALPHVRGYHLVPVGASKAAAVAVHRRDARLCARGDLRRRRLARGPRLRRARSAPSGSSPTRRARPSIRAARRASQRAHRRGRQRHWGL